MSGTAAGEARDLDDDLLHVLRDVDRAVAVVLEVRCAPARRSSISCSALLRVVRADLRAVAVLQRRDDAAAVRVVLRVGGGDDEHVERQAQPVAADLHVALFHDVEQADLDALGEVGELVDAEDAAVVARDQAVVNGQLVGEVAALGDLDRVDLADEVGDRDVGRRQLLAVAAVAVDPLDLACRRPRCRAGRGSAGRSGRTGLSLISQPVIAGISSSRRFDERADEAGLGLAALAEEDDVLAGEDARSRGAACTLSS